MTRYTNAALVGRFAKGEAEDGDQACHMGISTFEGWTLLWGYDWALYAARRQDDGLLVVYDGWYGHSVTTSQHMNRLKGKVTDAYGEPRDDGHSLSLTVTGKAGVEIDQRPAGGHVALVVDERPGKDWGQLQADGRPELDALDGRHVPSQKGYDG